MDQKKLDSVRPRLESERNIWMATVRPDGRPHLVPVWYVWHNDKIWISTPDSTVKVKNLKQNNRISVALEDGNKPVILEGTGTIHAAAAQVSQEVLEIFLTKYDWHIATDTDAVYSMLEVTPKRILNW